MRDDEKVHMQGCTGTISIIPYPYSSDTSTHFKYFKGKNSVSKNHFYGRRRRPKNFCENFYGCGAAEAIFASTFMAESTGIDRPWTVDCRSNGHSRPHPIQGQGGIWGCGCGRGHVIHTPIAVVLYAHVLSHLHSREYYYV